MSGQGPIGWDELRRLVEQNEIESMRRDPKVLEKYRAYKERLQQTNQSLFSHLVINELRWADPEILKEVADIEELPKKLNLKPKDRRLLANADDIKILMNDFPYYFDANLTHLCIWTKVDIKSDPSSEKGDISPKTRLIIERYVNKTFVEYLGISKDRILWFRNWSALQSVKNLSHIHVVIRDISDEQLAKVVKKSGVPVLFDSEDLDLSLDEYLS